MKQLQYQVQQLDINNNQKRNMQPMINPQQQQIQQQKLMQQQQFAMNGVSKQHQQEMGTQQQQQYYQEKPQMQIPLQERQQNQPQQIFQQTSPNGQISQPQFKQQQQQQQQPQFQQHQIQTQQQFQQRPQSAQKPTAQPTHLKDQIIAAFTHLCPVEEQNDNEIFGKIKIYRMHPYMKYVAAKTIKLEPGVNYSEHANFRHPGLFYITKFETDNVHATIYFEYNYLSLKEMIEQREENRFLYPENEIWLFIKQIIGTMKYLQDREVFHGDINTQNVFFDDEYLMNRIYNNHLLNAQYEGYSKFMSGENACICPEFVRCIKQKEQLHVGYNFYKADVFSFGMVLLEMLTLKDSNDCYSLENQSLNIDLINQRLNFASQYYSLQVINLISKFLEFDYTKRPDWIQLNATINEEGNAKNVNNSYQANSEWMKTQENIRKNHQYKQMDILQLEIQQNTPPLQPPFQISIEKLKNEIAKAGVLSPQHIVKSNQQFQENTNPNSKSMVASQFHQQKLPQVSPHSASQVRQISNQTSPQLMAKPAAPLQQAQTVPQQQMEQQSNMMNGQKQQDENQMTQSQIYSKNMYSFEGMRNNIGNKQNQQQKPRKFMSNSQIFERENMFQSNQRQNNKMASNSNSQVYMYQNQGETKKHMSASHVITDQNQFAFQRQYTENHGSNNNNQVLKQNNLIENQRRDFSLDSRQGMFQSMLNDKNSQKPQHLSQQQTPQRGISMSNQKKKEYQQQMEQQFLQQQQQQKLLSQSHLVIQQQQQQPGTIPNGLQQQQVNNMQQQPQAQYQRSPSNHEVMLQMLNQKIDQTIQQSTNKTKQFRHTNNAQGPQGNMQGQQFQQQQIQQFPQQQQTQQKGLTMQQQQQQQQFQQQQMQFRQSQINMNPQGYRR